MQLGGISSGSRPLPTPNANGRVPAPAATPTLKGHHGPRLFCYYHTLSPVESLK